MPCLRIGDCIICVPDRSGALGRSSPPERAIRNTHLPGREEWDTQNPPDIDAQPGWSALYCIELPEPGDALEFVLSSIVELNVGPQNQIFHGRRNQDLTRACQGAYPSREMH